METPQFIFKEAGLSVTADSIATAIVPHHPGAPHIDCHEPYLEHHQVQGKYRTVILGDKG
jgi:hypothetical protein